MSSTTTSSAIACTGAPLQSIEADFLAVPWFEGDDPERVPGVDAASGGEIARALASKEFAAKPYDLFVATVTDAAWRAHRILLVGAGPRAQHGTDVVRKLATVVGLAARQRKAERVAFVL